MISKARFLLSRKKAVEQYEKLKKYADIVSYSNKTNIEVGKVLHELTDSCFSVHSTEDFSHINSERIWYFPQSWNEKDIEAIFSKGVTRFVIDNKNDLAALENFLKKSNKKAQLLLRMKLKEHTIHTGKHFVFGMYSSVVNDIISKIDKRYFEKVGIHMHRKTQNVSEWSLKEELEESITCWDKIDFINIGGGIPAEYKNFRVSVIDNVLSKIKDLKSWLNSKKVKLIIEPGRYIAAPSVKLEATIINMYDDNIVLDCSIFNSALDTWIANIRLMIEGELEEGEAFTIKGCTPDSADILRYKVYLKRPKIGDKIVFLNAGAYNFTTDFCGLPKIPTVIER